MAGETVVWQQLLIFELMPLEMVGVETGHCSSLCPWWPCLESLSHVAAEPALPRSAPRAAREISHTTVTAGFAAGDISRKQHGI